MFDQLDAVIHRFEELEARLSAPGLYDDPAAAAALLKERGDLEPIVVAARAYHAAEQQKAEAEEMLGDPDLKELAQDELRQAKDDLERLEGELKILLLPRDPNDDKNIIVEIRGGAGGEESALFAHSLYRMYTMYAEKRGWTVELLSMSETELGGCKEVVFQISGDQVYSRMKFESGVHRVQRVPETESQGRVHTSTVTVAVLPEAEEVDFAINPADLKIDTFRSAIGGRRRSNASATRWSNARTNAASTRTKTKPCACCAPVCTKPSWKSRMQPSRPTAKTRLAPATVPSASAPTISRKIACLTTASN